MTGCAPKKAAVPQRGTATLQTGTEAAAKIQDSIRTATGFSAMAGISEDFF
jgi:hypothetical protein